MPDDHVCFQENFPVQDFFADTVDMLCKIDQKGSILWATKAWQTTLGWTEAQLLGQPLDHLIHPDDRSDFLESLRDCPTAHRPTCFRCRTRRRAGGYAWLEWRILTPARLGVVSALVRDVTEERCRVTHAAEVEKISGIGSWEIDIETEQLFWSPMTYAIHELEADYKPRRLDAISFFPPQAQVELLPAVDRLIRVGTPYDLELPFTTAKGREIWVRATAVSEMRDGKPVRFYGTLRDVTVERARRHLLEQLESVSRMTSNLVLVGDAEFGLVWVNPAFEQVTGYCLDELVGKDFAELHHRGEIDQEQWIRSSASLRAGKAVRSEGLCRTKAGGEVWLEHDIQPRFDANGAFSGFIAVSQDITDQRTLLAQLRSIETQTRSAMARMDSAVGALSDGLYVFDGTGQLVATSDTGPTQPIDLDPADGQPSTHRPKGWQKEEWLDDGRCMRMFARPMPDGGQVLFKVDVTEAKRQEQRLRDIISATRAITWELDLMRGNLSFGEDWLTDLGYDAMELGTNSWTVFESLIHPDDLQASRDLLRRRIADGAVHAELDFRVRRRDGGWIWLQDRGRVVRRASDGSPLWAAGTFQDITARKKGEDQLRAVELHSRQARADLIEAIEALTDGFIIFDAEDRVVMYNHRIPEIFEANAQAVEFGTKYEDILRARVRRGVFPAAEGREEEWIAAFLAHRATSSEPRDEQIMDGRWFRIIDRKTANGGRIGLRIDITELRESRRRLESIITGTQAGTWEADLRADYMIINARWAEMLGYRIDEISPTRDVFFDLIHPADLTRVQCEYERHARGETDYFDIELRMRHKNGHWIWVQDRGRISSYTASGEPATMAGIHIDITERKAAEAEVVAARNAAQAASKAKSQFLATMSHEIRTPLNGMLGIANILFEEADPGQRRLLGIIRESGETLLGVINDILDMSKIEAGHLDLECVAFAPSELARKIESLHGPLAQSKSLDFTVTATRDCGIGRLGDPHRILQILHNLVSNALKFTSRGSVSVRFDAEPDRPLIIEVRDTGIGITEDHQTRLFDTFSQADSSIARTYGGTGLGMSIVAALTEKMGGDIEVRSEMGKGTFIRVSLPLAVARISRPVSSAPPSTATPPTGLRVLVAEDNAVNRIILSALLERIGAVARMTENGPAAVAAYKEESYDLLLLDICMPEMDGIETLEAIRAYEAKSGLDPLPAVAVTANTMQDQIRQYLARGFNAHVSKPMDAACLNAAIINCLTLTGRARAPASRVG